MLSYIHWGTRGPSAIADGPSSRCTPPLYGIGWQGITLSRVNATSRRVLVPSCRYTVPAPCHLVSHRVVSCRLVSSRLVSSRVMSCHAMPCHNTKHIHVYICMYVCMCIYIYIYIYTHVCVSRVNCSLNVMIALRMVIMIGSCSIPL